ncbi:hypothetical protein [Corynebacterium aquatimens]|uniref:DUF559 domain-containing protein n=1 Tax=Corynebacterium aquatimens TaxID=1190508 RepID=A0A931E1C2_9CORY|nr:hypothetical protein [Corynebacterium aquatimens]MBG6122914.1 hypothetical protein [Corynebacterium aquatimens]
MNKEGELELIKNVYARTRNCVVTGPAAAVLMGVATEMWVRHADLKRRSGTNAGRQTRNSKGAVYRSGGFDPSRVGTTHGVAHVSVTQMLLDTYRYYGRLAALVSMESARQKWPMLTTERLLDRASELPQANGIKPFRSLIRYSVATSESALETLGRDQIIQANLPGIISIEYQVTIEWADDTGRIRRARVDMLINGFIAIEFDGAGKLRGDFGEPLQTLIDERSRERGLQNRGYVFLRVTWNDIRDGRVAAMVRSLILATEQGPKRTFF